MWNERESPLRLEKRFEFDNYQQTSKFMKEIDYLCKENQIFPNISFGSKFVSLIIFLELEKSTKAEKVLASNIDKKFKNIVSSKGD